MPENDIARQVLIEQSVEYSETILELLDKGDYDSKDDFTVVAQPFFANQRIPTAVRKQS